MKDIGRRNPSQGSSAGQLRVLAPGSGSSVPRAQLCPVPQSGSQNTPERARGERAGGWQRGGCSDSSQEMAEAPSRLTWPVLAG